MPNLALPCSYPILLSLEQKRSPYCCTSLVPPFPNLLQQRTHSHYPCPCCFETPSLSTFWLLTPNHRPLLDRYVEHYVHVSEHTIPKLYYNYANFKDPSVCGYPFHILSPLTKTTKDQETSRLPSTATYSEDIKVRITRLLL